MIRSTREEKEQQIENLRAFYKRNKEISGEKQNKLKTVAAQSGNIFAELMETAKFCCLGRLPMRFIKWVGNTGGHVMMRIAMV
ncbi:MAG: hypothetical protein JST47_05840 [Bacteroidetes bacterium]|nr:hypothetical protein [Bacteroidota bacterium]